MFMAEAVSQSMLVKQSEFASPCMHIYEAPMPEIKPDDYLFVSKNRDGLLKISGCQLNSLQGAP
jgi:hypothetical protein